MKLSCPQCGADIALQPRSLQLVCPFCNTPLKFSKEPFLERYRMNPTIEEAPATAIAREVLCKQNRAEDIETAMMQYLPFYRFLCEKNGEFSEHVYSALTSTPFPLFSVPSGTLTAIGEKETIKGPEPEKPLSEVLKVAKLRKAKSIEEMLLIFLPFWKITLSTGEIIWIDAVQGRVAVEPVKKKNHRMPNIYTKVLFSILLIILFFEGIVISPFLIRLFLQMVTAAAAFLFANKVVKNAS